MIYEGNRLIVDLSQCMCSHGSLILLNEVIYSLSLSLGGSLSGICDGLTRAVSQLYINRSRQIGVNWSRV